MPHFFSFTFFFSTAKRGFQLWKVILSIKRLLRLLLTSISVLLRKKVAFLGLVVNSCRIIEIACKTGAFLNVPHWEFSLPLFTAAEGNLPVKISRYEVFRWKSFLNKVLKISALDNKKKRLEWEKIGKFTFFLN